MKSLISLFGLLLVTSTMTIAEELENGFSDVDPVSLEVAISRGQEIYEHDQYAWKATDLVMERGLAEGDSGLIGFLTVIEAEVPRTYFYAGTNEEPKVAFAVRFEDMDTPVFEQTPPVSETAITAFKARQIALGAINRYCSRSYNSVVLEDGNDYLVYWLAASTQYGEVIFGGHYRFRINKDTLELVKKERLSNSCVSVDMYQGVPEGGKPVAAMATHLVTDTPLEIHTFLSRQFGLVYVGTRSGVYKMENGSIELIKEATN